MQKRKSRVKRPGDVNEWTHNIGSESTRDQAEKPSPFVPFDPAEVSKIMAEMGRRGGKIGGKRRLETLSAERRREIALLAAKRRWSDNKP